MVNAKKEVICDYCGSSNEPGQMLSAKKAYFGSKVSDVLHAITQRQIPSTLAIKVCFICFSKFVQCERTIQKIQEFVDQSLSPSAGKIKNGDEKEVLLEEVKKKKPMKKRSFSVPGLGTLQPPTIIEESPSKRDKGKTDSDILDNSVVLKPAKAIDNKKTNLVLDIFGPKATTAADSEEEEVEESDSEDAELPQGSVLIPAMFECRRCDFKVKQQRPMKQHYMQVHGQQRPRIFYCPMCTKSFGVAKTLKNHAKSAHGIEEPAKEKSGAGRAKTVEKEVPAAKKGKKSKVDVDVEVEVEIKDVAEVDKDAIEVKGPRSSLKGQTSLLKKQTSSSAPQTPVKPLKTPLKPQTPVNQLENETNDQSLTVIRALNEHKSKKKDVTNTEYTFAINDSSASTPKQNGEPMPSGDPLICTVCGAEQPSVKTMKRHMSTTHGIDKPKIFQCTKCEKSLASKQSLNYHMAWHLGNPEEEVSPKRQILQEDGPPSKRNKTKESADDSNVADQAEATPKKSKKQSETTNDVADGISSAKKNKKLPETTNDVAVSSPKKFKKISESTNDVTESPLKKSQKEPTVSLLSDDEKWVFPRPKKSKKERKESEAANISNGNGLNESQSYPLDDMAEVNPTVQPHKREMLTSTCESTTADESEFNCSQCPKSAKSQRRLESHIAKMHGKSLKCSNCYQKFPTRQAYVVHFGECEGEGLDAGLPCGVRKCTKIFETVTYLEDHLKKRHQW